MKILLSSVGRRGYLVKYFKEAVGNNGEVWGGDSSRYTPAFQYCDKAVLLPEAKNLDYVEKIINLCKANKIDMVIPLIDPELEVLAGQREQFDSEGILVVVSPLETIQLTFDKYKTYQFSKRRGIAVPQTVVSLEEAIKLIAEGKLSWPIMVKPRRGSASMNITYCQNEKQLRLAFETCPLPMIQQYIDGEEYGYDTFSDKDYRPISVFCKRKLLMRAGETDKAISTDDTKLIYFGSKVAENFQIFGPADLDVVMSKDGPKLLEINPRFGGGYPCSHLGGARFPEKLIAILKGQKLQPDIGSCPNGVCMLKQDEIIQPNKDNFKFL